MSKLVSFILNMMILGGKKVSKDLYKSTMDPEVQQKKLLKTIIKNSANTEFGKNYSFSEIKDFSDYESKVPLMDYDSLKEMIERMIKGENNILSKDDVVHYNVTSGTTGVSKNIPVTEKQVSLFSKFNSMYLNYIVAKDLGTSWTKGKGLSLSEGTYEILPTGVSIGPASSLHTARMERTMPFMKVDSMDMMYTSPKEARQPSTLGVYSRYLHALFALREKNITYGNVTFSSLLLEFLRYIENNWLLLCDDIENGTLNGAPDIPESERESVLNKLTPMPERAAELRDIFTNHIDETFGSLIWPDLKFFICVGGAGFQRYTDKILLRYLGKKVHILYLGLTSSEGLYSVPLKMDSPDSLLVPNGVYMEFIPVLNDERDLSQGIKHLWELEVGKQYELVITNLSGLYRYQLKDVIEVTGFYNKTPTIKFVNRAGFAVNLCAEKTSFNALQYVAETSCRILGLDMYDYCVCPFEDETGSRYVFLYELNSDLVDVNITELRDTTERYLCQANFYYDMALKVGHIQPAIVKILQKETFMLYHDLMIMKGSPAAQIKPVHVTINPFQENFFLNLVEEDF